MLDSRIIDRLYELELSDEEIALISYMYDNGDITEEDIFNIGDDEVFDIEKVGEYTLVLLTPPYVYDNNGNLISFNNEKWWVFDDEDSARDAAIEDNKNLIDDIGITGIDFGYLGGIENYVDTEWFEDAYRESEENYCWDILDEGDNIYDNRLVAECYEEGLIDDDDFEEDENGEPDYAQCIVSDDELVERYTDLLMNRIVDYVDEFKSEFGEQEFNDVVIEKGLVDIDKLCEDIVDTDGIANTLSSYDGEEVTYDFDGNTYYMYRCN